jgi:rubrerythrin
MATEKDRLGEKLKDAERAQEDLYFADRDRQLIEKMRREKEGELEQQMRAAALMRCPKCGESLKHVVEQGVGVEECPACGGMWLDRGELEQLAGREKEGWIARWLRGEFRRTE